MNRAIDYNPLFNLFEVEIKDLRIGQFGLWYDNYFDMILIGYLDKNYLLNAKVLYSNNCAWNVGYSYDRWDMSSIEYVGRYINYTSLYGYLEFINNASYNQIISYFKSKEILKKLNKST